MTTPRTGDPPCIGVLCIFLDYVRVSSTVFVCRLQPPAVIIAVAMPGAVRPLPDPLGLARPDYLSCSLSNLFTAVIKAVVCLVCSLNAVAKASKCALKAVCRRSISAIRRPMVADKAESALAVLLDSLSEASQALAKASNCDSKARSKGVRLSIL